MVQPRSSVNVSLALLLAVMLGGCSFFQAAPIPRGNRVTEDQLAQISPGVQTRRDVQALLGSPSFAGTFDDANWYYLSATSRTAPGRRMQIEDRRMVAVTFDRAGVVQSVRTMTEADGQSMALVERETPVPGTDRSILQQLFGNIGRFGTPGGTGTSGPAPGAGGQL
jgi:outer membrane protein assembly factor BamE (lipoprotein component of BamABCDE complex)